MNHDDHIWYTERETFTAADNGCRECQDEVQGILYQREQFDAFVKGSIYIYSHWGGYTMPEDAAAAIKFAQDRWDDEPYAARIIVDQLTKGGRDEETGYGLMLGPDAEDSYNHDEASVIIDLTNRSLTIHDNDTPEDVAAIAFTSL